jgi:Ca-activated chloride channel family protein
MLGDALGLAVRTFERSQAEQRTLILLTDGNDTDSRMTPAKAAEIAARNDVTIHTIGIGDPAAAGEAPLDVETLQAISTATGGEYFRADDREQLAAISATIDELEPMVIDAESWRPRHELYAWPLGAAVVLILAFHVILVLVGSVAARRRSAHA